jgi:hypothetical protein
MSPESNRDVFRARGGIGRHAWLRTRCREASEFNSRRAHHNKPFQIVFPDAETGRGLPPGALNNFYESKTKVM